MMAEKTKQKIRIRLKAHDNKIIDEASKKIIETAERTGAMVAGPIPLPTDRSLHSVIRASFVHKKSQEQFEVKVHKRLIDVIEPTSKTIDSLMSLSLPAGVEIEIKMN